MKDSGMGMSRGGNKYRSKFGMEVKGSAPEYKGKGKGNSYLIQGLKRKKNPIASFMA